MKGIKKVAIVKSNLVMAFYLSTLFVFSVIAGNQVGSLKEGIKLVFYGFYFFSYSLLSLKDGFPIAIREETGSVYWFYILSGFIIYFFVVYIIHFYQFSKLNQQKKVSKKLLIAFNVLVVLSYLYFELMLIGFATI